MGWASLGKKLGKIKTMEKSKENLEKSVIIYKKDKAGFIIRERSMTCGITTNCGNF